MKRIFKSGEPWESLVKYSNLDRVMGKHFEVKPVLKITFNLASLRHFSNHSQETNQTLIFNKNRQCPLPSPETNLK